jgi:hypothetical protein
VLGELAAVAACAGLLAPLAARTAAAIRVPGDLPLALGAALLGCLAADLVSGLVHWLCDTFFSEDTPLVGRALIRPFREHHRDPLAITRRAFLEVNGSNCLATLPLLALAVRSGGAGSDDPARLFAHVFLVVFAPAVCLTNQLHKWAHAPAAPRAVRLAQRLRLVLAPAHHARHHGAAGRAFCVTTGWLNPLLDRLEVLPRLERTLRALAPPPGRTGGAGDDPLRADG